MSILRFFSLLSWESRGCGKKSAGLRCSRQLCFENLEPKKLFAVTGFEPTNNDQYVLELVNRARQNPIGEVERNPRVDDLNQGLPAGTISTDPKQPLAFNLELMEAARGHTDWLIATNVTPLSHIGQGGKSVLYRG